MTDLYIHLEGLDLPVLFSFACEEHAHVTVGQNCPFPRRPSISAICGMIRLRWLRNRPISK